MKNDIIYHLWIIALNSNLVNLGSGYLEPSPISGTYGSANSMLANTIRVHRLALIQLRGNFTGVFDIPLTSFGLHDNDRNVGSYSSNGEIIAKGVGTTNSENALFVRAFPQGASLQISASSPDLYEVLIPLCINE